MYGMVIINGTAKAEVSIVPSPSGSLTYTGAAQSPAWNGFDSSALELGGVTSASDAGTYAAVFSLKEGYVWSDGTTAAKQVYWTIERAAVAVPTVKSNPTYNGSAQSPTWNGYDSSKMTIGGTTSATNSGSYTAAFTPDSNHKWSDGTTTLKNVTWSISKAAGSLSLDKTSMALDMSTLTGTIAVTRAGDGAITASSSNTNVATVSVSGNAVIVTAKAKGSATVTVNVATGSGHTAPASKTCAVTVDMPSTTLNDNTPAQIQAAAKAGIAPNYWSVGDKIGIALNGTVGSLTLNDTYYAFIIGFNHNRGVENDNDEAFSIHFQFGKTADGTDIAFCDEGYGQSYDYGKNGALFIQGMSSNGGVDGRYAWGWSPKNYMRQTICPEFLAALPTAWQNIIVDCIKWTYSASGANNSFSSNTSSYIVQASEKIWPLSSTEVSNNAVGNSYEKNYQRQYAYYKNGNSKVKYKHNDTTTPCIWWLRSGVPETTSTKHHVCVLENGSLNSSHTINMSYGFAPGFMVA